jgi:enamine deaminase RidA (YjgF/YER057c/UK114 family)
MRRFHPRPQGSPPVNNYSHAVEFSGRLVAVSGQVALDAEGRIVGVDDVTAQVRQVFRNLEVALGAAGASLENIVQLMIFLTDIADLDAFRAVRDEHFAPERAPASTLVQVNRLVRPEFKVEIAALAAISG